MRTQAPPNSENRAIKDINLLKTAKALGPDGVLTVTKSWTSIPTKVSQ
jgi:hypothetical protein